MVVDGRKSLVGSDRGAVEAAIQAAQRIDDRGVDVDGVRRSGMLSIRVGAGSGSGRILLIGYDPQRTTVVRRGENAGRTLRESNIVRSMQVIGNWTGAALTLQPAARRRASIQATLYGQLQGGAFLLLLAVCNLFAMSVSLGSGSSGGVFSPSLYIGATLGAAAAYRRPAARLIQDAA